MKRKSLNILPSYTPVAMKEEEKEKSSPLEKKNRKPNKTTQTKFIY